MDINVNGSEGAMLEEGEAPTEDGPMPANSLTPAAHPHPNLEQPRSASLSQLGSSSPSYSSSSSRHSFSSLRPVPGQEKAVLGMVDETQWVPDDMATTCCLCKAEFNQFIRRRHHCRACGRVVCDDCSSKRLNAERTCDACWDRIGRKMSGLGLKKKDGPVEGGVPKSALMELLEEERYNREFVMADGRTVSYSEGGMIDGLPVFLFLGLDSHRYVAANFEDLAHRRGLRLICIDRPGRGRSGSIPALEVDASSAGSEADQQALTSDALEAAVCDTVKQMCAELRIDKAGLLGQSLGAWFALRCARDEELKSTLGGAAVCLVSPYVPLAAPGTNSYLRTTSTSPIMASAVGFVGADLMIKKVGDMARGSSGASVVEKGYMQAPYTQDLAAHVSGLKEGRESIRNEVLMALHNKGEDEAKERCVGVLHDVKIWHGRSDQLVPYKAVKWLEKALPSCTSEVILGGTHALLYDQGSMDEVFTALQKGVSEARSSSRYSARRLTSKLSYVASSVFAAGSVTAPASSLGVAAGQPEAITAKPAGNTKQATPTTEVSSNLRERFVRAISKQSTGEPLDSSSAHSSSSINGNNSKNKARGDHHHHHHDQLPRGSNHSSNSSGHGLSQLGLGGSGSGHESSSGGGRRPSATGSRHGSDSAPPPIPENGEVIGWKKSPQGFVDGSRGGSDSGGGGVLGQVGSKMGRALSEAFGVEVVGSIVDNADGNSEHYHHDSGDGDGGNATLPPISKYLSNSSASLALMARGASVSAVGGGTKGSGNGGVGDPDLSCHSVDSNSSGGIGRAAADVLRRQFDRAVSSLSIGEGSSAHGSMLSAGGSGHGSVVSISSTVGGGGGGGGGGSLSRRSSGLILPWSQSDVDDGGGDIDNSGSRNDIGERQEDGSFRSGAAENDDDDIVEGFKRGLERALSAVGVVHTPRSQMSSPRGFAAPSPRGATNPGVLDSNDQGHDSGSVTDSNRFTFSREPSTTLATVVNGAGYDAAMANWPAGKVEGNPAWEEWGSEKKLFCHFVTAGCLALIILTW